MNKIQCETPSFQNTPHRLPDAISIVIPLYNEAGNIHHLVEEIIEALEQAHGCLKQYEIILVNDGSDDNSGEIITGLEAQNKTIIAIHHASNYGQSRAIHSGISKANFDWIVTLDGDGQYDPTDILKLVSHLQNTQQLDSKSSVVIMGQRRQRQDSHLKQLSSRLANKIRRRILNDYSYDTGCSLKLFQRQEFLKLPYFDHIHRFLPALFQRQGLHIISLKVNHRPRQAGTSKYGFWGRLWVGLFDLIGVYWLIKRYQIIKFKSPIPAPSKEHSHTKQTARLKKEK